MKTTLNVKVWMMAFAAVTMTACVKDSVDMTQTERLAKATFEENFVKKYPNVDLNRSWDLSTKTSYYSFGSGQAANEMRGMRDASAVDYNFVEGDFQNVDLNTVAWMREKLTEGVDHRALGKAFYMTVPGNEFTIMPIFQGEAGAKWDLHLVVDGVNIKVWEKSQDIELKSNGSDWHAVETESDMEYQRSTLNASAVRAKTYTFKNLPVGADMYFYLEITQTGNGNWDGRDHVFHQVGDKMTSVDQMLLALNVEEKPNNVPEGYQSMIIGCEDGNTEDSDWDMNDVVFLVYGKKVPQPIEITEGTTVYDSKTVRYMIEDLGSTDDFDFNDIVIDVTESTAKTPVYVNDVLSRWEVGTTTQKAVIRHLGGTLPFILTIGDTQLKERPGVLGADPNETFEVSGWNMKTHNVSVKVRQNASSTVYNEVKFPKAGEAPMIIAVDPSQNWMEERVSVPESWFYIPQE